MGGITTLLFAPASPALLGVGGDIGHAAVWEMAAETHKPMLLAKCDEAATKGNTSPITAMAWHSTASKLFYGNKSGTVVMMYLPPKVMRTWPAVILTDVARNVLGSFASVWEWESVYQADAPIVQLDASGNRLVVSTRTRCILFDITAKKGSFVGKQLRDEDCGACFLPDRERILCARPKSRMWIADMMGVVESTLKISMLFSERPDTCLAADYSARTGEKNTEQLLFGRTYHVRLGRGPCIVMTTALNSNVTIFLDPWKPSILHWYLDIKDIKDIAVDNESVFVLHSDGISMDHFLYITPPECVAHFVQARDWGNALTAFEECHRLLGNGIFECVTLGQLQDLAEGVRQAGSADPARLSLLRGVLEEMRAKFSVQEARRMQEDGERDGIVTVCRPGIGVYATTPHAGWTPSAVESGAQAALAAASAMQPQAPVKPQFSIDDGDEYEDILGGGTSALQPAAAGAVKASGPGSGSKGKRHKKRVVPIIEDASGAGAGENGEVRATEATPQVDASEGSNSVYTPLVMGMESIQLSGSTQSAGSTHRDGTIDLGAGTLLTGSAHLAHAPSSQSEHSAVLTGFEAPGFDSALDALLQASQGGNSNHNNNIEGESVEFFVPERTEGFSTTPTAEPGYGEEEESARYAAAATDAERDGGLSVLHPVATCDDAAAAVPRETEGGHVPLAMEASNTSYDMLDDMFPPPMRNPNPEIPAVLSSSIATSSWLSVQPTRQLDFTTVLEKKVLAIAEAEGLSVTPSTCTGKVGVFVHGSETVRVLRADLHTQRITFYADTGAEASACAQMWTQMWCDEVKVVTASLTDARFRVETAKEVYECNAYTMGARQVWMAVLHFASVSMSNVALHHTRP